MTHNPNRIPCHKYMSNARQQGTLEPFSCVCGVTQQGIEPTTSCTSRCCTPDVSRQFNSFCTMHNSICLLLSERAFIYNCSKHSRVKNMWTILALLMYTSFHHQPYNSSPMNKLTAIQKDLNLIIQDLRDKFMYDTFCRTYALLGKVTVLC